MKLLNLDWAEMLDALCIWEDLLQSDKEYFLYTMEPGVAASESVPADTADSLMLRVPYGFSLRAEAFLHPNRQAVPQAGECTYGASRGL
jgi:hypothetical protein